MVTFSTLIFSSGESGRPEVKHVLGNPSPRLSQSESVKLEAAALSMRRPSASPPHNLLVTGKSIGRSASFNGDVAIAHSIDRIAIGRGDCNGGLPRPPDLVFEKLTHLRAEDRLCARDTE